MIIGLAGKSCSGKNQIAALLQEKGFETVDMDLMAHEALGALAAALSAAFGSSILDEEDQIDRVELGRIVFTNPEALKKLEDILYPELHRRLDAILADLRRGETLIVNAAALQKADFWKKCDRILWVEAPLPVRLFRAYKRDRRSVKDLISRFRSQRELKSQYFFSRVDTYIIRNGSTRKALRKKVDKWIKDLPPER
ncbi:MAG: dephospho-CoA kinase [Spirochaetales bacterium]|nr:dephospho-CoA kinase [Spirochaetales bacterium]